MEDFEMKRSVCICMTTVMAVSILTCGAVSASALSARDVFSTPAAVSEENGISGSWKRTSSPELTDRAAALFHKVFDELEGAVYAPVALLATRNALSGTQYRLLCKQTLTIPDADEQYVTVALGRDWLGRAKLLDISDAIAPTDLPPVGDDEAVTGGLHEAESPAMTEDAAAAFRKATDGLVGVNYVPVALLSTQVVAGTNYRILCEATTVYPGAEMHYVVITVYESLDGSASILNVSDSFASAQ